MTIAFWTARGAVDLADLQPANLSAEDLGEAMAKINRHAGRTPEPWSVAAHSVLVETLCPPDLKPWALLHDAHKVFLGDLIDPAVELLCQSGIRSAVESAIQTAEARIDRRIAAAWGVAVRSMSEALRAADQIAFLAEAWAFLGVKPGVLSGPDTDLLDRAMSSLQQITGSGAAHDWRQDRDLWLTRIQFHASLGALSPPRGPDPSSAVLAG